MIHLMQFLNFLNLGSDPEPKPSDPLKAFQASQIFERQTRNSIAYLLRAWFQLGSIRGQDDIDRAFQSLSKSMESAYDLKLVAEASKNLFSPEVNRERSEKVLYLEEKIKELIKRAGQKKLGMNISDMERNLQAALSVSRISAAGGGDPSILPPLWNSSSRVSSLAKEILSSPFATENQKGRAREAMVASSILLKGAPQVPSFPAPIKLPSRMMSEAETRRHLEKQSVAAHIIREEKKRLHRLATEATLPEIEDWIKRFKKTRSIL